MKLLNVNFKTGLSKEQIEEIEKSLHSAFDPAGLAKSLQPEIAELIAEQGNHALALQIGLKDIYLCAKSFLFLGQVSQFEELLKTDISIAEANLGMALRLRMSGEHQKSLKLLEEQILPGSNGKSVFNIHAHLEAGSSAFNCSQYQKSFEYYKTAYEFAEELGYTGKMAIAAFNASVAAKHVSLDLELRTWLWYAENLLKSYYFPSLQKSIDLFAIEQSFEKGNFEATVELTRKFLDLSNLTIVQRLIGLQTMAKSLLELGYVVEAESYSSQARHMIQKNRFYQYEVNQLALETNIEVLTHRKIARERSINSPSQTLDKIAGIEWKSAFARKSIVNNDLPKALKLYQEIQNEQKHLVLVEDLAVYAGELGLASVATARGAEVLLIQILKDKRWAQLKTFIEIFSKNLTNNSWFKSLNLLAEGFLFLSSKNQIAALQKFELALQVTEDVGLERLTTLALGVSAIVDTKRQADWMDRVNNMEATDKMWFSDFFTKSIGRDLVSGKWIVFQNERKLLPDFVEESQSVTDSDLVIDQEKGQILFQNSQLPISGQSVLFQIVLKLAESQKVGLSKEELVQQVWGYEYDPSVHDSVIYTNIRRLRELLPVELYQGKYRISTNLTWCLISSNIENGFSEELSDRQIQILKVFKNLNLVSRRDVVRLLEVSERTALRELTELVQKGILSKHGMGRSVSYTLLQKSEAI